MKKPIPTEAQIQRAIVEWLHYHGYVFCVTDAQRRWTMRGNIRRNPYGQVARGWPDITCVGYGGRAVLLEIKKPGGRVMPHQREMHDRIRKAGGIVAVVRSVEDVARVMNGEVSE